MRRSRAISRVLDQRNPQRASWHQPAGSPGFFAGNSKFLTRKLWGFANEPPFFHHGLYTTIRQAVLAHAGEARLARMAYDALSGYEQDCVIEFLKTLQVLRPGSRALIVDEDGRPKKWSQGTAMTRSGIGSRVIPQQHRPAIERTAAARRCFVKKFPMAFACAVGMLWTLRPAVVAAADDVKVQIAQLYQLQGNFHRAASVHDWRNGDSQAVVDQRIIEMLDLWSPAGTLHFTVGGPNDGFYDYRGAVFAPRDAEDESLCPKLSGVPGGPRGTLCTFFRYVSGSFQSPNKLASLAPAYLTQFDLFNNYANVYFECHFFNVAPAPASASPWPPTAGLPAWTPTGSQLAADGSTIKHKGEWRFYYLTVQPVTDAFVPDNIVPSQP